MSLPLEIEAAVQAHAGGDGRSRHRTKLTLAKLVAEEAPPGSPQHLALVEGFLDGAATPADLAEARKDVWAYVGSLACHCTLSDSSAAHVLLSCLEPNEAEHTVHSLREHVRRVLQCGASADAVLGALKPA